MRRALLIATSVVTAAVVAGCGGGTPKSSSTDPGAAAAHRLLVQAFDRRHTINSGVINLDLKVVPSGSSSITGPITLSFGGPFMNTGAGKLPESDFTISISAEGHTGALQVVSAAGKGYITVSGQSYRVPASSFKNLESGFGSLASSGGGSSTKSGSGAFSSLGIKPLQWLVKPQIVGTGSVDGVKTTRIRAGVDARAMLRDLSTLLGKANSLGVTSSTASLPHSISASTQRSIAHALGSPSFNLWTGANDKMIRKLTLAATIPVTGQTRSLLGGMRSATVTLAFEYSHLNQPQTITVPSSTKPYSVFRQQVSTVLQQIESGVSGATGTTTNGSTSSTTAERYTQCITAAKGDVSKMQRCSSLLGSG